MSMEFLDHQVMPLLSSTTGNSITFALLFQCWYDSNKTDLTGGIGMSAISNMYPSKTCSIGFKIAGSNLHYQYLLDCGDLSSIPRTANYLTTMDFTWATFQGMVTTFYSLSTSQYILSSFPKTMVKTNSAQTLGHSMGLMGLSK